MSLLTRALFILVLFMAGSSAWAKHVLQISFNTSPELQPRIIKVLESNGYSFKSTGTKNGVESGLATFDGEDLRPTPQFLIDLYFHTFFLKLKPIYPVENNRTVLRFRLSKDLTRSELAALFADLQAQDAWIESARLVPFFNFAINFATSKQEQILKTIKKYDYIDKYEIMKPGSVETLFMNDPVRRGVVNITVEMLLPHLTQAILEEIPSEVRNFCVHSEVPGDEYDNLVLTCPNEFKILEPVYDALERFEMHQTIRFSMDGDYLEHIEKRDSAHIIEEHPYKRIVLKARQERAFEVAKQSSGFKELKEKAAPEDLAFKTYSLGLQLLRESVHAAGYSIFRIVNLKDKDGNPIQQIYVELPDEGISTEALSKLLNDFTIYPYLDKGSPAFKNELVNIENENCERFLSK